MQYGYAYQLGERAGGLDPDAKAYILAVEAADGQTLESGVKKAYNTFVKGCKSDGIWDAIKASCIMAGARTLSGALVPLKGTAPTNFNFVSGDYARKTGLIGNASTKYLNSNRNANVDPQNSFHQSIYASTVSTTGLAYIGAGGTSTGSSQISAAGVGGLNVAWRNRNATGTTVASKNNVGLIGHSRNSSSMVSTVSSSIVADISQSSESPFNGNSLVFARLSGGVAGLYTDARLSFYSIGESIDLAKLNSRVSTLITNIVAAIP